MVKAASYFLNVCCGFGRILLQSCEKITWDITIMLHFLKQQANNMSSSILSSIFFFLRESGHYIEIDCATKQ